MALVTGAGSGIGRATVHRLVDEGATVLAVDLSADGLADDRGRSASARAPSTALAGDVTDPAFAPAAVAAGARPRRPARPRS